MTEVMPEALRGPLHEADNPADRVIPGDDPRPDPKVTYLVDGMPFGEYDGDDCWWIVRETKGWHNAPGMKTARSVRPQGPGDMRGASWRKSRLITLKGICWAPSVGARLAALDRFNAVCADGGRLHELKVTDQLGRVRTADVELEGEPDVTVRHERRFDWQIQLAAPDPRKHGAWQDPFVGAAGSKFQTGSDGLDFASLAGLDFASGGGLSFGTPDVLIQPTLDQTQVANYGSAPAFPLFRLRGPMPAGAGIRDLTTARDIYYQSAIATGETVWINADDFAARGFKGHAVWSTERGNVRARLAFMSAWPQVDPGAVAAFQLLTAGAGGGELMTSLRSAWT